MTGTSDLGAALSATEPIVAAITGEHWEAPTCCPDWSVHELLNHLVAGNQFFAAALTDQAAPDRSANHLAGDPLGAYQRSATALQAAFAQPGAFDKVISVQFGPVPGAVALHLRLTEILVHAWDLAHAIDHPTSGLPADVAERELEFSRAAIANLPVDQRALAPPQPVGDDAPAIDRLAALLGRPVAGPASHTPSRATTRRSPTGS